MCDIPGCRHSVRCQLDPDILSLNCISILDTFGACYQALSWHHRPMTCRSFAKINTLLPHVKEIERWDWNCVNASYQKSSFGSQSVIDDYLQSIHFGYVVNWIDQRFDFSWQSEDGCQSAIVTLNQDKTGQTPNPNHQSNSQSFMI